MRSLLLLAALIAGCGGSGGGSDVMRESPEPNGAMTLGTGGTYSLAGSCDGQDEDVWEVAGVEQGDTVGASLSLDWSAEGLGGTVHVLLVGSVDLGSDQSSVELEGVHDQGFTFTFLEIECAPGIAFDYSGSFGVR